MTTYAYGRHAFGFCDRCDFRYELNDLKQETVKGRKTGLLLCPFCRDKDHPQLFLGTKVVDDPQALFNPRPDRSEAESRKLASWDPVGIGNIKMFGFVGRVVVNTGGKTTEMTGVSATGSVGSVLNPGAQVLVKPTGPPATGAVGTVTVDADAIIIETGEVGTGAVGSVTVDAAANAPVTGLAGTGTIGDESIVAAANVPVTGEVGTSAVGTVTVDTP